MKTNLGLVAFAQSKLSLPTIYMLGGFGRVLTNAMIDARIKNGCAHTIRNESIIRKGVGKYVYDCNGIIKGYLWEKEVGKVDYNIPTGSDLNVRKLFELATQKGAMTSMPELLGLLVFTADLGHVGIYVGRDEQGNRQYIEATPAWNKWGVTKSNDGIRTWAFWGTYHLIQYLATEIVIKEVAKSYSKVFEDSDVKINIEVLAK